MSEEENARADEDDEEADWFERALREPEESDGESAETTDGDPFEGATEGEFFDDGPEEGALDEASGKGILDESSEGAVAEEETSGGVFEQDFATAFQNAPTPDDGGLPSGGLEDGFEDEEFDSSIPRIDVGIEGLDQMIQGGIPERSLMAAVGDAGTGKTTFGLQFVRHGLENGENAVFITLEQSYEAIISTADDKDWDFSGYRDEGQLAVLDLDPIEMANSLTSIRNELPDLVREFGASRLVLDSVSLLEMMYDTQATRRTQIYDFTQSLKEAGVTTMLTSEASEEDPYHSRFGIIEYLTDAVFVLRYIRPEDFRETRLAVEIQKIRDANHSREMKPYEITNDGINVYRQANIF